MKIVLKIQITQNYKLKLLFNDKEEEYTPCILFNKNTISICKEEENKEIYFMKEWIENSDDFKVYSVEFQNKTYELLPEVFFAIIINELKYYIEREFIIEKTIIEIPTANSKSLQRIQTSLQAINMNGIEAEAIETDEVDYNAQGEMLFEIIEKKKEIDSFKRMIERAKLIKPENTEKLETIDLNKQDMFKEETFTNELVKRFSTKEIAEMKMTKLDNYCLFIASRYIETLDDHFNLTMISKRMKRNMEKFFYNPVSVNEETMNFFPNMKTQHTYSNDDKYLEGERIERYIDWSRKYGMNMKR